MCIYYLLLQNVNINSDDVIMTCLSVQARHAAAYVIIDVSAGWSTEISRQSELSFH